MTDVNVHCSLPTPCPRLRVVAVVLAAGTASRMGGRPKCLLQRDGQSLLARLLHNLQNAGINETVLVLGHNADRIEASLRQSGWALDTASKGCDMPVHRVLNPQPSDGQNSSLHVGLAKAQSLTPQWLMVALADQPLLEAQDLRDLMAAVKHSPHTTQFLQPLVKGQPGNPVMLSAQVMQDLLQSGAHQAAQALPGGKAWRQQHPEQALLWPTPNTHYCVDMDSPDDMTRLAQLHGIQLEWGSPAEQG